MQSYESLTEVHLDRLAEKVGGRYRLTRLVAQRLRDVNAGAPLLVERKKNEALLAAVCREIELDMIQLDIPETEVGAVESEMDILGLDDTM